jgi:hypothetical protein
MVYHTDDCDYHATNVASALKIAENLKPDLESRWCGKSGVRAWCEKEEISP